MMTIPRITLTLPVLLFCGCVHKSPLPNLSSAGSSSSSSANGLDESSPLTIQEKHTIINIRAVGDVMTGSIYPDSQLPDSLTDLFAGVPDLKSKADLLIGNLEGVLTKDTTEGKPCKGRCYSFAIPPEHAMGLRQIGFDFMSVANNHTGDFGSHGRRDTRKFLTEAGIGFAGHEPCDPAILERQGIKVGFLAFSPSPNTCNMNDSLGVDSIVRNAKKHVQILIVSVHAGAEGQSAEHTPYQREIYLGTDRGDIRSFAHQCIGAGADLILGQGPHVARGLEVFQDRLIAYSLGNFATWKRMSLHGETAWSPVLDVSLNEQGVFVNGTILSAIQDKDHGPIWDSLGHSAKRVRELTDEDFSGGHLVFDMNGFKPSK